MPENSISDVFFVRSEYQLIKIDQNEIEYIESVENYLKINRTYEKRVMTLMTLKAILEKLPKERFIRIHRSYVIPISKIKFLGKRKIKLSVAELPVSDSYIDSIKKLIRK